jgi:hypothetical protein
MSQPEASGRSLRRFLIGAAIGLAIVLLFGVALV